MNAEVVTERRYITVEEAADRIGRKPKTIRNWACAGQLGSAACYVRGRLMIDWPLFEQAVVKRGKAND